MKPLYKNPLAAVVWTGLFIAIVLIGALKNRENPLDSAFSKKNAEMPTLSLWDASYEGSVRTLVIETPPATLPAHLDHPGLIQEARAAVPESLWIIGSASEVINAPHHVFHHLNLLSSEARSPLCHGAGGEHLILAAGQESHGGFFPVGYGYLLEKEDLVSSVMFHNHDEKPYPNVRVRLTLFYIPLSKTSALKSLQPLFLSTNGTCEGDSYTIPAGETTTAGMPQEYIFERPGKIVFMGAHLHGYGKELTIKLNDIPTHTFLPIYAKDGTLERIPLAYPKNLTVRTGDRMNFSARYTNTSSVPIEVMSQVLLFVHETNDDF